MVTSQETPQTMVRIPAESRTVRYGLLQLLPAQLTVIDDGQDEEGIASRVSELALPIKRWKITDTVNSPVTRTVKTAETDRENAMGTPRHISSRKPPISKRTYSRKPMIIPNVIKLETLVPNATP